MGNQTAIQTNELQFAYKPNSGCDMALFALSETIKYYHVSNTPVYGCFLDATKAFNRVSHYALLSKLIDRGVDPVIISCLKHWITNTELYVRYKGEFHSGTYVPSAGCMTDGPQFQIFFCVIWTPRCQIFFFVRWTPKLLLNPKYVTDVNLLSV